jgi:hypothetical protein
MGIMNFLFIEKICQEIPEAITSNFESVNMVIYTLQAIE